MIRRRSTAAIVKDIKTAQTNIYNLDNAMVLGEDVVREAYNALELSLHLVDGRYPKFITK